MYHCKSDTESISGNDDLVLTTTCFTDVPVTFGTMYGCTEDVMEDTESWLERCQESAFHPLVLPMIFAEHERKRLLNEVDKRSTELEKRILELENRVNKDTEKEAKARQTMTQRDCEAINLWRSMSSVKNGLESLKTELGSMKNHLHTISKCMNGNESASGSLRKLQEGPEVHIDARLKEMMAELQSKIRSCEGLLGSMTLATQMVWKRPSPPANSLSHQLELMRHQEWNHYTRIDAQINFGIAAATRMDSSQMKQISMLGMIFLPATFLAVSCPAPTSPAYERRLI